MPDLSTIQIGMSGLAANSQWLNSIGNNIANMNTVAFKSSRPKFADVMRGTLAGGGDGADGMGVAVLGSQLNFAQGGLSQSANPMDWAIDGNGFFTVKDTAGNSFYTRAGQFALRAGLDDFKITGSGGHVLQGYVPDEEGLIGNALGDVTLDAVMEAKATTKAAMVLNLDSSSVIPSAKFDAQNAATYNFSASKTIFDERTDVADVSHTMTAYFVKAKDNVWDVHVGVDGGKTSQWGRLTFDTSGQMTSGGAQTVSVAIPIPGKPASGETPAVPATSLSQSVTLDFSDTTQYGSLSSVLTQSQNGYGQGRLETVSLGGDGIITGHFSNEQHQAVAQVALASFKNVLGLSQLGKGLFAATQASGSAETLKPGGDLTEGQASVGQVKAGMLELSNVELTDNFVDMIAAQFGFQGSSKAISSADELLQIAINLKR